MGYFSNDVMTRLPNPCLSWTYVDTSADITHRVMNSSLASELCFLIPSQVLWSLLFLSCRIAVWAGLHIIFCLFLANLSFNSLSFNKLKTFLLVHCLRTQRLYSLSIDVVLTYLENVSIIANIGTMRDCVHAP